MANKTSYIAFVLILVVVSYGNAFAYIDPATGSYFLQLLLAGVLGALFALKVFWRNIKGYFQAHFSRKNKTEGHGG